MIASGAASALAAGCGDETLGRKVAPPAVEEDAGDSAIDPGGGSSGTAGAPATGGTGAAGGEMGAAGTEVGGSGGSREDAGMDSTPDAADARPTSLVCGDSIRDPVTEECDDGPGTTNDSCLDSCRVQAAFVVPTGDASSAQRRHIGLGRHVAASHDSSFGIVYVEENPAASVWLRGFDPVGAPLGQPLEISPGSLPIASANPVVAAVPTNRYALAWVERSANVPKVVLRSVSLGIPISEPPKHAHESAPSAQADPDVIWTGSELVVAWTERLDISYRRFGADLAPIAAAETLASSSAVEGDVALVRHGTGWAAAWRSTGAKERIYARTGSTTWNTEEFAPGPAGDRPALVELDARRLLLVFSVGTDPFDAGRASAGKIHAAVLDLDQPGLATSAPLAPLTPPYNDDTSLGQSRPDAVRIGSRIFAAWESDSPLGDPLRREVWIQELGWTPSQPGTIARLAEHPLVVGSPRNGDQQRPALGATNLFPEGAAVAVWEEHTGLAGRPNPDVAFALRPVPFVPAALAAVGR